MEQDRGSLGHILRALTEWGVAASIVNNIIMESTDTLLSKGKVFAKYAYFEGIEQPLFHFMEKEYRQQSYRVEADNTVKPIFKMYLSHKGQAIFEIRGNMANEELYHRLKEMTCQEEGSPEYDVLRSSGAFFDTGFDDPRGQHFLIEFWETKDAQKFIDHLNNTYDLKLACTA